MLKAPINDITRYTKEKQEKETVQCITEHDKTAEDPRTKTCEVICP